MCDRDFLPTDDYISDMYCSYCGKNLYIESDNWYTDIILSHSLRDKPVDAICSDIGCVYIKIDNLFLRCRNDLAMRYYKITAAYHKDCYPKRMEEGISLHEIIYQAEQLLLEPRFESQTLLRAKQRAQRMNIDYILALIRPQITSMLIYSSKWREDNKETRDKIESEKISPSKALCGELLYCESFSVMSHGNSDFLYNLLLYHTLCHSYDPRVSYGALIALKGRKSKIDHLILNYSLHCIILMKEYMKRHAFREELLLRVKDNLKWYTIKDSLYKEFNDSIDYILAG